MKLKLKFQYLGSDVKRQLTGKDPNVGKHWAQKEEGTMEDEMVGWHHQLNEYEFQQTAGGSEEQEAWHSAVHGGLKEWHDWAMEQQQKQVLSAPGNHHSSFCFYGFKYFLK